MRRLNKLLALALVLLLAFTLAACGDSFESAMVRALREMQNVESVHADMALDMSFGVDVLGESTSMDIAMDMGMDTAGDLTSGEFTMTMLGIPITVTYIVEKNGDAYAVDVSGTVLPLPKEKTADGKLDAYVGKQVKIGVRPEDMKDDEEFLAKHPNTRMEAEVEVSELMGAEIYLYLTFKGQNMMARVAPTSKARRGDKVTLALDPHKIHVFDAETEQTILN